MNDLIQFGVTSNIKTITDSVYDAEKMSGKWEIISKLKRASILNFTTQGMLTEKHLKSFYDDITLTMQEKKECINDTSYTYTYDAQNVLLSKTTYQPLGALSSIQIIENYSQTSGWHLDNKAITKRNKLYLIQY